MLVRQRMMSYIPESHKIGHTIRAFTMVTFNITLLVIKRF